MHILLVHTLYIYRVPSSSHRLSEITSSWAHLLKMPFGRSECLLMMWDKDSNLAHINSPSPDGVLVADHIKWFSQGFIHSVRFLHSFSLLILVRTLWISIKENMLIYNHCIKSGWGRCNFLKPLFAKNFFHKLTLLEMPEVEVVFYVGKVFPHIFCNRWVSISNKGVKKKSTCQ